MRRHYRDRWLIWLLPVAYMLHLLEEWFGGLPEWMAIIYDAPLPRLGFLAINTVAFAVLLVAIRAAAAREKYGWTAIAVAAIIFVNALVHLLGSLITRTYSPGLITGLLVYLPLGALVLMRAWMQAPRPMFVRGVAIGLAVHALVVMVAYTLVLANAG